MGPFEERQATSSEACQCVLHGAVHCTAAVHLAGLLHHSAAAVGSYPFCGTKANQGYESHLVAIGQVSTDDGL